MGMVCATILEAAYCWGVANNKISAATTLAEAPFTHLVKAQKVPDNANSRFGYFS